MTRHAARLAAVAGVLLAAGRSGAVSSGPISAGCYTARGSCHVQLEPFTLAIGAGHALQRLEIRIDGHTAYDFRPDQSNPPILSYAPTMPGRGFAAPCDASHVASVVAQDTGDASPVAVGGTATFTCPRAVPEADASAFAAIASLLLVARAARPRGERQRESDRRNCAA